MSTEKSLFIPRRQVIRGILSTTAFAVTSRIWTGCTPAKEGQARSDGKDKPIVTIVRTVFKQPEYHKTRLKEG